MTTRRWVLAAGAIVLALQSAAVAGPEDQVIANRIAATIKNSGQLSNYRLGVKFEDGVATLLGSVTDQAQAEAAVTIAGKTQGVARVVNNLEIKEPAKKAKSAEQPNSLLLSLNEAMAAPKQPSRAEPQPTAGQPRLERINGAPQPAGRAMPAPMGPSQLNRVNPASYGAVQPAQCASGNCGRGGYAGGYAGGSYGGGGYGAGGGAVGVSYDSAHMPAYAWPSYASYPNYAALTYPRQYSPTAWPYIGPFYPYPQVPLGWRKVALEWDDGWWFLDFSHCQCQ